MYIDTNRMFLEAARWEDNAIIKYSQYAGFALD